MSYNSNSGIISAPVSIDDVKQALLSNMTDEEILAILKKKVEADTAPAVTPEVKENVA